LGDGKAGFVSYDNLSCTNYSDCYLEILCVGIKFSVGYYRE